MVGHLPLELSRLLTYFLEAHPENKLDAVVIEKRKREHGLIIPAKYTATTTNKDFANILGNKLNEKTDKHPNFEIEVVTKIVHLSVSTWRVL